MSGRSEAEPAWEKLVAAGKKDVAAAELEVVGVAGSAENGRRCFVVGHRQPHGQVWAGAASPQREKCGTWEDGIVPFAAVVAAIA